MIEQKLASKEEEMRVLNNKLKELRAQLEHEQSQRQAEAARTGKLQVDLEVE